MQTFQRVHFFLRKTVNTYKMFSFGLELCIKAVFTYVLPKAVKLTYVLGGGTLDSNVHVQMISAAN